MKVQLQAVSLRMQALRSNEQMAVAMKGATRVCQIAWKGIGGKADSRFRTLAGYGPNEPILEPASGKSSFPLCEQASSVLIVHPLLYRSNVS